MGLLVLLLFSCSRVHNFCRFAKLLPSKFICTRTISLRYTGVNFKKFTFVLTTFYCKLHTNQKRYISSLSRISLRSFIRIDRLIESKAFYMSCNVRYTVSELEVIVLSMISFLLKTCLLVLPFL